MALPKRNSFFTGFVCAFLLVAGYCVWQNSGVGGGVHADSPDGQYSLSAMAPLSPESGGTYDLQLRHKKSGDVVRQISVSVTPPETTVALRGGGGSIEWDPASTYAELHVDGRPIFRVWVP